MASKIKESLSTDELCQWGRDVIRKEAHAVANLEEQINADFAKACNTLYHCKGRIAVLGLGKSGHIGQKIAATLASTGSPAFFIHASEANHGDFGMITEDDIILAISNSGKTPEILALLPQINALNIPLIAITGDASSPLATRASINLHINVSEEAGPLDLAPTSSTTATLAMGDAIAITLLRAHNFNKEDFARAHPGGSLGKRLLLRVEEVMRKNSAIPSVPVTATLKDALLEMTAKHLGMTSIVDDEHVIQGIFTDGDLRRTMKEDVNLSSTLIKTIMTTHFKSTHADKLAYEVFTEMENAKITAMPVVDDKKKVIGIIHLHDILQTGLI